MNTTELLAELETLTHNGRIARMLNLGKRVATEPDVAETIKSMEQGDFYQRYFALQSCATSRDSAHVRRSLTDPSRIIRGVAVTLVSIVCGDNDVQAALEQMSFKTQRVILRHLFKRQRYASIDTFLATYPAKGDDHFAVLLPFGSQDLVVSEITTAIPKLGIDGWNRLSRLHPTLALTLLNDAANAAQDADYRLLQFVHAALPALSKSHPDEARALVKTLNRHVPLLHLQLKDLVKSRPNEVADLVLASEDRTSVSFEKMVDRLEESNLLALVARRPSSLPDAGDWLPRITPSLRQAAYEIAGRSWRNTQDCLNHTIVANLPSEARIAEGRRHITLPTLAAKPEVRLPYASYLPWAEAQAALEPSIRNPDADLRAVALSSLIGAARYNPDHLSDVLQLVRARRFEQDPVRRVMLTALAELPPSRWTVEQLNDLGQIVQDALDAADLSSSTAGAIAALLTALVPFQPGWTAKWLATFTESHGYLHVRNLENRLSDADVTRIGVDLLPVVLGWEERERSTHIVQLATMFGRRIPAFEGLTEILERVLSITLSAYIAENILTLLSRHRRFRLASVVPAQLEKDQSAITLSVVYNYLHRRRQDLLTPYLGQKAYRGRFSTGYTRFVLPFKDGFHRWTPQQQTRFAATLTELSHDPKRDIRALCVAVSQLAALPAILPTRLIELASVDPETKPAVRESALRALANLDAGQGIPALLDALQDERARIAIYALRRSILAMAPERALEILQNAPVGKVTVAKEVIRLLGELKTPEAYAQLLALDERQPPLHRDASIALLRALWDHLEQPETWPILDRAAVNRDPAIASGVIRIPTDRLGIDTQIRLVNLIAQLLTHPDPRVRIKTLERCSQLPLADPNTSLLPRLLTLLNSVIPDEVQTAARAVFATYGSSASDAVGESIMQILHNRRALQMTIQIFQSQLRTNTSRLRPTVQAILRALSPDPLTASFQIELTIIGLPWTDVYTLLTDLTDTHQMHAGVLADAIHAIEQTGKYLNWEDTDSMEDSSLAQLELALANHPDAALRRLALATLVAQSTTRIGWSDELLSRLRHYREDTSPLVASAAQFTLPIAELGSIT